MSNPIYALFDVCYRCDLKYPKFVIRCLDCGFCLIFGWLPSPIPLSKAAW